MENQTNIPQVDITEPSLSSVSPQKNNYKLLFFIFLALFLTISIVLVVLLIKNNQKQSELITKDEQTQIVSNITPTETTITPTETINEANILKISDIQMDLPKNWTISSITGNKAKILTDYKKYQVYLILEVTENADTLYESRNNVIKTQYGEVFGLQFGGPYAGTGASINNKKYYFIWNIAGNQPTPANLDGIWIPDNNITPEIIMDITKTVKPLIEISSIPKDWKTYTNATYKLSINYPSTWTVDTNPVDNRVLSISSPEKIKSINSPTPYQEGYSGDDLFINVYKKTLADCKDLETCFNSTGDTVSNIRKIKIGKLDGYLVDEAGMATTPAYFVFSSTNLFKFTSFIKFSETEKQILDTLKFN